MVIPLPKDAYNSCKKWRVNHDKACMLQRAFPFSHKYIYINTCTHIFRSSFIQAAHKFAITKYQQVMHFLGLEVCEEMETLFCSQDLGLQQLILAEARAHFLWEDTHTCSIRDVFRE